MSASTYVRPPFDDATAQFRAFLASQGWPTILRWVTRDRLAGYRRSRWVYRPDELDAPRYERAARQFYEQLRASPASIRVDALGVHDGRTLAYVEDYGGESAMLNFGAPTDAVSVTAVSSRVHWTGIRVLIGIVGGNPFLRYTRLTPHALAA